MAKATSSTYRILTHRQRLRRSWHTQTINNTHRVGYDPTVYEGVIFLGTAIWVLTSPVNVVAGPAAAGRSSWR